HGARPVRPALLSLLGPRQNLDGGHERKVVEHASIGQELVGPADAGEDVALPPRRKDGGEGARRQGSLDRIVGRACMHRLSPQKERRLGAQSRGRPKECDFGRLKRLTSVACPRVGGRENVSREQLEQRGTDQSLLYVEAAES